MEAGPSPLGDGLGTYGADPSLPPHADALIDERQERIRGDGIIRGRVMPSADRAHTERVETLRQIAADVFALAERMTCPARSIAESEAWISTGEELARDLRQLFRGRR